MEAKFDIASSVIVIWDKTCDVPVSGVAMRFVPDYGVLLDANDLRRELHDGCEYELRAYAVE